MKRAEWRLAAERTPRTARGALKREKILDAAAKVIARRGYTGTTLSEIAQEVGIAGAGSLYHHFESREHLVEEVLRRGVQVAFAESRRAVAALSAEASPLEQLNAAFRAQMLSVVVVSDYARATGRTIGQVPAEIWARVNAEFRRYGRFYDRLIAAAMDAGEIDPNIDRSALRMLVIGAINWAPEWYRKGGRSSAEEVADLLVRLMTRGVATRKPAR